jgi:hypothetical protein
MKNDVKQDLQNEVLISCLDVLCRANATVFESDPKLAADIAQAIESLTTALQSEEPSANTWQTNTAQYRERPLEPADYCKKNSVPGYFPSDDAIVDVLTNEVIRKPAGK